MPLSIEGFFCQKFSMYQIKFLQMIVIFPKTPQTVTWGGSEN